MWKSILLVLLHLVFQGSAHAQNNSIADAKAGTLRELEESVYLFQGTSGWFLNSLVLEREDGLVLVDTQFEDENNQALIAEIQRVFPEKKVDTVIISHAHLDHFIGVKLFEDAFGKLEVVGLAGEREHMEKTVKDFWPTYQMVSEINSLQPEDIVYPTREVKEPFEVSFSGKVMRFTFAGPNESWKSMIGYLPGSKTVYVADMYWGMITVDSDIGATLLGWTAELKELLKMDIDIVVSGHGNYLYVRNDLEEFVTSLDLLIETGYELLDRDASEDEFVTHVFPEEIVFFGDRKRQLTNVYHELRGEWREKRAASHRGR